MPQQKLTTEQTVGVMGGYILGGGHSPLSSIYGMAADQILSLDIVLANGEFTTASASNNTELFWALRGGGGSTFGVVTSVTIKAYPPLPVTSFSFIFNGEGITITQFWAGVRAYWTYAPSFVDAGTVGFSSITLAGIPTFSLSPVFAPNLTIAQTQALLAPFISELSSIGIKSNITYNYYPTYYSGWYATYPQETVGTDASYLGSRLFPRANFLDSNSTLFNSTFAAWQASVEAGLFVVSLHVRAPLLASNSPNAVNPAWRQNVLHSLQFVGWTAQGNNLSFIESEEVAARKLLHERQAAWKAVTPGAGGYLAESFRHEIGWQQSFYGDHYERLLAVKKSIDPEQVFWAKTSVGSEGWDVMSPNPVGDEDGPLCRV
jgi:hypothetical protein